MVFLRVFLICACMLAARAATTFPTSQLASALVKEDLPAVQAAVAACRTALGDQAGVPEVPDRFQPAPTDARQLTRAEAQRGFTADFARLEKLRWWHIGDDPTRMEHPLREPASVLSGLVTACRAKLDGMDDNLALARETAEFLMWAQGQAGAGLFPFPAARGSSRGRAMVVGNDFVRRAEAAGKLGTILHRGWVVDDLDNGGLQFDNGECGVALFEYYELTRDPRALASARQAADWSIPRPLVPNWNYNSFSVWLLAKAFAVTGEKRYLEAATRKARVGVIPGQLRDGPHAGRWIDPHNARPAYHYILLRALAQLALVLPKEDPSYPEVMRVLTAGLKARNGEFVSRGAATKEKATQTLLLVFSVFAQDEVFLRETQSAAALDVLARLVSAEYRQGRYPLAPAEWGAFLAYIQTLERS